jgi:hypothetical protein
VAAVLPRIRYTGLPPARAFAFGPLTGATVQIVAGSGVIYGWGVEETTGLAPARLVVGDGTAAGVNVGLPIDLSTSQSTRDFMPNGGWLFQQGIAVQVTAGTVGGVVLAVLLDPDVTDALSDVRHSDYE